MFSEVLSPSALRLAREFKPWRRRLVLILALGLVISTVQPVSVRLTQAMIDHLQKGSGFDAIRQFPFFLVGLFLISGLAKYFHQTLRRTMSERIVLKLRSELFSRHLYLPMRELQRKRAGEWLSGLQADLATVGHGLDTACDLFKEPLTFLGLVGVAFWCDWKLTLGTLLIAPLVVWLFSRSGVLVKRYSVRNLAHMAELMSLSQESLTGGQVVKIFNLEHLFQRRFTEVQEAYFQTARKSIGVQETVTPSVELVGAILMAFVLAYGGWSIAEGSMTTGRLIAFIVAIGLCQMPIKHLNSAYLRLKVAEAAAERVFAVIDTPPSRLEQSGTKRIFGFQSSIVYQGVSLAYGDRPAIQAVSFTLNRGERLALVGPSGSGKSTIVNLLARLYDPDEGQILIDGMDLKSLALGDLRKLVSFVTQDTFLFNDTIRENIRLGKPGASDPEIEKAAEFADCVSFIGRFPDGFETKIGDRGMCLSGGERQRLAIARAILKNAPILVLDEATSSLDSHSEHAVQRALAGLMEGKTTLMIAHRLSTVTSADRILVLEKGAIRESGTHAQLLRGSGLYQSLFERQLSLSP